MHNMRCTTQKFLPSQSHQKLVAVHFKILCYEVVEQINTTHQQFSLSSNWNKPWLLTTKGKNFRWKMVFCYQNCSDLLWEKIVLVIQKNFWNSRLKAEDSKFVWNHLNNLFKQWKVRTIFGDRTSSWRFFQIY